MILSRNRLIRSLNNKYVTNQHQNLINEAWLADYDILAVELEYVHISEFIGGKVWKAISFLAYQLMKKKRRLYFHSTETLSIYCKANTLYYFIAWTPHWKRDDNAATRISTTIVNPEINCYDQP
jgi:hypothetical protein